MRVLVVTNMYPSPDRRDWGTFVASQVESLRSKGVEMDLLVIKGYENSLNYLTAIFEVRRLCACAPYDLVHAHYGLSGLVALAQFRCPLVVSYCGDDLYGHSDDGGRVTATSRFWVAMGRLLSRRAAAVIVKSRDMARLLPRSPDAVIPNGVDFSLFRTMDRRTARRELGLADERRYLLFPYAPTNARKNYRLVAAAVARLNAKGPECFEILTVHGEGPERMPLYMNAADVLVLVSFWEGSPNVVKEAMACNMRIVAADVGDVAEIIAGVEGCRICERDPEDLARKVREVLAIIHHAGGREAVAHLALDKVADQVIEVYRHAIEKTGGPR